MMMMMKKSRITSSVITRRNTRGKAIECSSSGTLCFLAISALLVVALVFALVAVVYISNDIENDTHLADQFPAMLWKSTPHAHVRGKDYMRRRAEEEDRESEADGNKAQLNSRLCNAGGPRPVGKGGTDGLARANMDGTALDLRRWPTNKVKIINSLCDTEWNERFLEAIGDWSYTNILEFELFTFSNSNGEPMCFKDPNSPYLEHREGYVTIYHADIPFSELPLGVESSLAWAATRANARERSIIDSVVVTFNDDQIQGFYRQYASLQTVMCHELGHALGIPERDVDHININRGSCIDYSIWPQGGGVFGPANIGPGTQDFLDLHYLYPPPKSVPATSSDPPTDDGDERRRLVNSNRKVEENQNHRILVNDKDGIYLERLQPGMFRKPKINGDSVAAKNNKRSSSTNGSNSLHFGQPYCFDGVNTLFSKPIDGGQVEETMTMGAGPLTMNKT